MRLVLSNDPFIRGVVSAFGRPDRINYSETTSSRHAQAVYSARHSYIYVEGSSTQYNLTVTSIQF